MNFHSPQINLYVEDLAKSKAFYESLGFKTTFTAEIDGLAVHHELVLEGFTLGIATKESAVDIHGLAPGGNSGCELVFWVDDADRAVTFLIEKGAKRLSEPHDFLNHRLRAGWIKDPDGNPIQLVCKRA
ncbi:VOC family protein [Sporolactobacillus sp. CPB3-1]|uniref:VOC family protein n=1 Tax=Sporolactobacillus mangiferae TaxID=2940498 RepID=A0ABT0MAV5_9BACL|nr:VOC family protein [Sporolactobacillus mangiferae]MCL1631994.1 VOC family protein [Sporolactobacillus mangiferae]